jgi:hypothetical protein
MKKIIALALLAIIMVGCEETKEDIKYATDEKGYTYELIVIDSCEYICTSSYKLAHKGNCKYCLERSKKMIKEQIDTALIEIFD